MGVCTWPSVCACGQGVLHVCIGMGMLPCMFPGMCMLPSMCAYNVCTQITEELTEVSDTLNISTILGSLSPFPKHFHPVPDFIFCCLLPYLVSVTSQLHITGLICKYESLRFYLEVHMVCMSVLPKSSLKRWNTNTYIPSTRMMALGGGALGRYLDYEDGALVNRTSGLIKETPLQDP